MAKLVISVKQGEVLSLDANITVDGQPLDLSLAEIVVEVKEGPYIQLEPMFRKVITVTSDPATDGQIIDPLNGRFQIRLNAEDTSYPPNTYSLVVFLKTAGQEDIISADFCNNGEYRVCTQ